MEINIPHEYTLSNNCSAINFDQVAALLKHAYWCKDISIEEIKKGANNSALVVAAYDKNNDIVGYLRVISDKTRFAYILDVYVDIKHRNKGIATAMIKFALHHPELKDVYQWLLVTQDAHDLYKPIDFESLKEPDKWMGIIKLRPKR